MKIFANCGALFVGESLVVIDRMPYRTNRYANRKISRILQQNLRIKFFNSTPLPEADPPLADNPPDGNREEGEFGVIPLFEERDRG